MLSPRFVGSKSYCSLGCVVALAMSTLAGCSDSGSPVGPAESAYTQTLTGTVPVFGEAGHPITIPRAGNMTAHLTWADSSIDLDLYLATSTCSQSLYADDCQRLSSSISTTGTSESVARTVAANEQFHLWIDNLSATQGSNYTVVIEVD